MALGWHTLRAFPTLRTYAEALEHYNRVTPIRGDAYETRPVGRRDQQWKSIWLGDDKAVCIGHGSREISSRSPVVKYYQNGVVELPSTRWMGRSTQEMIERITGIELRTYMYTIWVRATIHTEEGAKKGWWPLKDNNRFVLGTPTAPSPQLLNWRYPVKHTLNKQKYQAVMAQYEPFLSYLQGMAKLYDDRTIPAYNVDELAEALAVPLDKLYETYPQPMYQRNREVRERFLKMISSEQVMDHYKAMMWYRAYNRYDGQYWARSGFTDIKPWDVITDWLKRIHRDEMFDAVPVTTGQLVRDRYTSLFVPAYWEHE